MEGPKPLFNCKQIRANCVLYKDAASPATLPRGVCGIHAVMMQAEKDMRQSLAGHSLADIANGVTNKISDQQRQATDDWFSERAKSRTAKRPLQHKKERK